jgi:heme exporter protein CcmD
MREFFDMSGYAWYVWPSYILTIVILLLNVYWANRSLREARAEASRRFSRESHS